MLNETSIGAFKAGLRGELIEPGSPRYDEARKVYNAMIDRRPRLIARCTDVADVIAAVNFAARTSFWSPSAAAATMPADWESATTAW